MKHLWNIAAKKDNLWVKWINSEKLKGRSIWEVPCEINCSNGWKNILKMRDKVRKHVFFELGNGESTSAWQDKWCKEGPLCEFISAREVYDARFNSHSNVADLISQGEWCWPADWYTKFPQLSNVQVPTLNENVGDKAVWMTRTGMKTEYKTKTVWNDMINESNGNKVKWCSMIWFPQCIPKHTFVLWMAVQERLMTQDKIARWKQNEIMECTLCKQCMDSHEHLFFQCDYTRGVWTELQNLLDKRFSYSWKTIIEEMTMLTANKSIWSILRRLMIGAAVYYVWQERNNRLFNKGTRSKENLVQNIVENMKLRMMSFYVKESSAVLAVEAKWNISLKRSIQKKVM